MSFESIYKLSVVMGMIDNLSSPLGKVTNNVNDSVTKLQSATQTFGNMTQTGAAMVALGSQMTSAVLSPVEATFETKRALGELASLGIQDLNALEKSATDFSNTWAGTTKADFITAAYDIKSGIASLSDEGVAEFTNLSGITAKATKSTIAEMTDLFATGYGIYKDYYADLSDLEFGEMFSAGIAQSVQKFKTTGSGMSDAIKTLGAEATSAQVPLEEQMTILGMLQATMSGSEAGTKYKSFLKNAAKAGDELGLSFVDANNQLLSMPEILDQLKNKFGDTMDAAEKIELQKAFGDQEAVGLISLMYNKTGDLQNNILGLYDSMGSGIGTATDMANAINQTEPEKFEVLKQKFDNAQQSLGNSLLPTVNTFMDKATVVVTKVSDWIDKNQELSRMFMMVLLVLSLVITGIGAFLAIFGGVGLIITKTIGIGGSFISLIKLIPGLFQTLYIKALYAGDGIAKAFGTIRTGATYVISSMKSVVISMLNFAKTAAINAAQAVKSFVISMATMAKQAITTAVTAMPGLIASVWAFTVALLANPITWIIIGIVALIAALILLWRNWDTVVAFISGIVTAFVNKIVEGFNWVKEKITSLPAGFQILLGVLFPFISIPMLIISNWGSIVDFFRSLPSKIQEGFTTAFTNIKTFFNELPEFFRQSGAKVLSTFAQGVQSAISKPYDAVKGALTKVRQLLPFSDAKEGPLSTLTLSGNRVLETISTGISQKETLPAQEVDKAFQKVDLGTTRQAIKKVSLSNPSDTTDGNGASASGDTADRGKNVIIKKLMMNIDFSKISDLKKLLKLLEELEDYTNGNGEDGEPELA